MSRFPQWTVPPSIRALYQPDGGLVDAAMGNSVHVQLARARGATVLEETVVQRLEHTDTGAIVSVYGARRGMFSMQCFPIPISAFNSNTDSDLRCVFTLQQEL